MKITRLRPTVLAAAVLVSLPLQAPAASAGHHHINEPAVAASSTTISLASDTDLNSLMQGIQRHLVAVPGGYYFDATKAKAAGESEYVMTAGASYNALAADTKAHSPKQAAAPTLGAAASIPVWGNWCGPGHSGPGAPKDTLDTLCMRHDKCYAARGYFNCYCDAQLKAEIARFSDRMGWRERAMAAAITVAFSATPCKP